MSAISNAWAKRFELLLGREAMRQAVEFYPEPLSDLGRLPIALAVEKLKQTLGLLFYPSEQCLDFLEDWVGRAYAHAILCYSDPIAFAQPFNHKRYPFQNGQISLF